MTLDDCSSSHLDVRLLRACRSIVVETDPTPAKVVAVALGAFAWRTVDTELAEVLGSTQNGVSASR